MAGEETDKTRRQGFARAFTAGTAGKGGARKNLILPAFAILLFAGVAVAIGALTSAGHAARSAASVSKVVNAPAASGSGTPARAQPGAGWPAPAVPPAAGPGGQPGSGNSGPGSPAWPPAGAQAPAPAAAGKTAGQQAAAAAAAAGHPASSGHSARPSSSPAAWVVVTGQVDCTSGDPVEGFWIAPAGATAGWANWQVVGSGPDADYWLAEPPGVARSGYKMSVGCGGTRQSWLTPTYTRLVTGTHNSFNCDDQKGTGGYGTCTER